MDFIKLAIVVPLFFVAAPIAGLALKQRPLAQRWVFGLMCFMTINGLLGPGNWGLTIQSIEAYRGHTKGYHFYFNHALAIALIFATWRESPRRFRFCPPLLGLYVFYCGLSLLSIVNAPQVGLAVMAAHKMIFASVIFVAAFNYLRSEKDLQFFLKVMAFTMTWQLFVVLKLKYVDGIYQVRGTFEHQNPLAMYGVMIGMVLLATGIGPRFPGANFVLWGFLASAVVVQATLSRASLAIFAAGTVGIVGLSLLERPTFRRLGATAFLSVVGVVGLLMSVDTIIARFNDRGNQASSELREVMNLASREMAKDHWLGIGWNNYALAVNPPFRYAEIYYDWDRDRGMTVDESRANAVVESHYYLLLAENGYVTLAAYLVLIAAALGRNLQAMLFFPHSFQRCLSLGIAAGCSLNYVQSTLERVLVQPRNLMLWLLLLAITARVEMLRREAVARARSTKASSVPTPRPRSTPAREPAPSTA